jgi:transcriptional regulator with XRE-family HTH domain
MKSQERVHRHLYRCLGTVVSDTRRKLNLSQQELAERAGIDRVYLSNVENGKSKPSFAVVADIAQGLKIRYARLVGKCEECSEKKSRKTA